MNQEEEDIPNPMLDSVRAPIGRRMLMTVGGSKSRLFTPPTLKQKMMSLQQINNMTDSETETTVKYEQFAFLQPKKSHNSIPYRNPDIINGEECTITMKVLVNDTCLPEIFHKTAMGYTIQLADTAGKSPQRIDTVEEIEAPPPPQLIQSESSVKTQFKRATKKIQQFRLVSDALKQVEEEKLTKENIQIDLEQVNNFLNTFNLVQSTHLLKDSIEQDRKRSMRRFMRQVHSMTQYNENCPQTPYQQKSKVIHQFWQKLQDTCIVCGAIVAGLFLVFCLAYMKSSINEIQITDL